MANSTPLRFGTISYNIHANFTNYGSALQTWALHQAIKKLSGSTDNPSWRPVLVDYCPDCLADKDPFDPMRNMWDTDAESRRLCELSLPAIHVNARKFDRFYHERFDRTEGVYTSANFDQMAAADGLDGFVCGSDTIFCIDEFDGFDDGYYANYPTMRGRSVAYAASFGDPHFKDEDYPVLDARLGNFRALGLREDLMVPYCREHSSVPVQRVLDPTLTLEPADYEPITADRQQEGDYLLLYSRRYNAEMERYALEVAQRNGWEVVEISLRAENAAHHRMFYEAGVEEFLALVRDAQLVVTNSFHGAIFAMQFSRPFWCFSREQADTKIEALLEIVGLEDRLLRVPTSFDAGSIDYADVHARLAAQRVKSLDFLRMELELLQSGAC